MQVKWGTYKDSGESRAPPRPARGERFLQQRLPRRLPSATPGWVERELETLAPALSSCSHTLLLCPPALAQVAPAGSLPHAGAFLRLPGAGAHPHRSPWPQSPRVCNRDRKKPRRETRILLPPGSGGETAPRALPQMSRASPCSAGTRRSPSPLRSLASPALRDTKGKGEQPSRSGGWRQVPSAWAGMSGPHRVDCRSGSTMVSRSGDSM